MKTTTRLLAIALGALATLTVQAEAVNITLEGQVRDIVTERRTYQSIEPVGWQTMEVLHPTSYKGFTRDGGFKLDISFDSETGFMGAGKLTNSQGQVIMLPDNPNRPMLSPEGWSIHFPQAIDWSAPTIRVYLGFTPGTFPTDFSAEAHRNAAAGLQSAAALIDESGTCTVVGSIFDEARCTNISATFQRVTIATAQQSITAVIPEPATFALMLMGILLITGVSQRQRLQRQRTRSIPITPPLRITRQPSSTARIAA